MHMYLPSPMYGPNRLHCNGETNLITKIWHKFNKVSWPWKWSKCLV